MKAAKTKKRRVFDAAMNIKSVKDKIEKRAEVMENKYLDKIEKQAGLISSALNVAKNFGKSVATDSGKLGDQLKNVGAAYKANGGLFNKGTMSTIKTVAKNRAVQTGAGVLGAGIVAGRMSKQASENKYLEKIAQRPGYGEATATVVKAPVRSALEGVAGAALGAGAGLLALKTKTGAKAAINLKKTLGIQKGSLGTRALAILPATAGMYTGAAHGGLKSVKNSLNDAYTRGQYNQ